MAHKDPARYADLKPKDMDGNQFAYHLKQLLSDKMIVKNDDGTYSLTSTGKSYLVHRYENQGDSAHTIFLVVIRNGDNILLRKRKVQPMLGWTGFVHGEPLAGEALDITIKNRVKDKTGLNINNLTIHGSGLIRMPESFSHAIIVSTETEGKELPIVEDETGINFWTEDALETIDKLIPSTGDILEYINDTDRRWFDLSYDL